MADASTAGTDPRADAVPAHADTANAVVARVGSDAEHGLTAADAAARLAADGPNELTATAADHWWRRVVHQLTDPLVVLLQFAVVISLVAWMLEGGDGLPWDAIVIAAIIVMNTGIDLTQSQRADAAVAALGRMAAAQATVVRGGELLRVPSASVVVGDLIGLGEGDAVAADARLVEAASLRVAEASLTGESAPVEKSVTPVPVEAVIGDRGSMVHAGTAVAAGRGRAVVTATGMRTEVGQIADLLDATERSTTPLEQEIAKVGRLLGGVVVAIAVVVVAVLLLVSDVDDAEDVVDALLVGVSLAVAAVPEGLPAVLAIVLALGVQRMARRNALVKRLASAETLGSATVICSDKTGTLTRGEMTVQAVVTGAGRIEVSGTGYAPTGELLRDGAPLSPADALAPTVALRAAALASNAHVERSEDGWRAIGAPTEAALVAAVAKTGAAGGHEPARLDEIAFTSDRKRMSVLLESPPHEDLGLGAGPVLVVKGAPDVLLARCTAEWTPEGAAPLTSERREWWESTIDELADDAMRTLAVAVRAEVSTPITEDAESDLVLLGLMGIIDPPRAEARDAVAAAHRSGVRVVMITGDHPRTAARIASDLGIGRPDPTTGRPHVLAGTELDGLDDEGLLEAAVSVDVFARVAPVHKLRIVRALQSEGEVVAMTGDGVNDAPALKAADIGTAMGIAGTDVAREASAMILVDDNFATIVAAIHEGRGIFHNIRSFLRYLLSSNIGEVLTVFAGLLLAGVIGLEGEGILAPLTATQILWINLLTDTGPALALGVDPPEERLMHVPPRARGSHVIDAAMQRGIAIVGATMAAVTLLMFDAQRPGGLIEGTGSLDEARTAAFTVLVFAQLYNCFSARSDTQSAFVGMFANRWMLGAVAVSVGLQLLVVHLPLLNDAFGTEPLGLTQWLQAAALASAVLWVAELRKVVRRRTALQSAA